MGECRLCKRKGLFLSVNANGLCKACNPIVVMDVQQRGRIIDDSMKLVASSKKMGTRLSRCDLLLEHAAALTEYENKGIPTISPAPSQLLREYTSTRDQIILEGVQEEVEKALTKAEIATTTRTAITEANKGLLKIREGKRELRDKSKLNQLESRVRNFTHRAQLKGYLETARKAEFKGQKKKAIDQYQEALFFLRNDEINDSFQKDMIGKIQRKIKQLEA